MTKMMTFYTSMMIYKQFSKDLPDEINSNLPFWYKTNAYSDLACENDLHMIIKKEDTEIHGTTAYLKPGDQVSF